MNCKTCERWIKGKCQCEGGPNEGVMTTENDLCLCHEETKEAVNEPHPPTQMPEMESDRCSIEVLIESHAGFYVGYWHNGIWYDSINGGTMYRQFEPWRWYDLPKRGIKL